ncbi:hypothetical protein [Mesorhizobium sp. M0213]|uniref:hypothetical protein n=1 Tax=unclassified Mesorhizobium TaxID=325217 RepID=UPI0033367C66
MKCFLSFWERHHTGTLEQFCLELGRPGLRQRKDPGPDPTARRMTLLRIMQQIQSIDRESRDQPNFSHCVIRMWKGDVTKIHAVPVSDSRQSAFYDPALWKSLTIYF